MTNFDDLRLDDDFTLEEEDDDDMFSSDHVDSDGVLFLGMTPVERMFISIFLFMNVAVLGIALLLVTGRMG